MVNGPPRFLHSREYEVDPSRVRDISDEVLGDDGRLRVLPAAYWATTTPQERALFGTSHGIYSFPTVELVDHLRAVVDGRSAIEIGAGNGVLAEALDIPATDSFQQREAKFRAVYELSEQAIVPYGPNVIEMDARQAVRRLKPEVVIACWVTHKYNRTDHFRGGNMAGVDEVALSKEIETYVFVGNEIVHKKKPLWDLPYTIEYPDFVYSRAMNGSRDFVARWNR